MYHPVSSSRRAERILRFFEALFVLPKNIYEHHCHLAACVQLAVRVCVLVRINSILASALEIYIHFYLYTVENSY